MPFTAIVTTISASVIGGFAALSTLASPPIQNPGAPGQATRTLSVQDSVAMSQSSHTRADVRFMQHMIIHHAQAVEMNALIEGRSDQRQLRLLGQRIARSQSEEMELMRRWLSERGEPVSDPDLHGSHDAHHGHGDAAMNGAAMAPGDIALMPGMLSPNQMSDLTAARGAAFDRLFLEGMIHHHRGALDMVEALLSQTGNGEDPQLSEFLTHVTADQAAEILRMQSMLSQMSAPSGDQEEALRP